MYRTRIQRADAGRAARPQPASLPASGFYNGLGASAAQVTSMVAAVNAGQYVVRGHQSVSLLEEVGWGEQAQVGNRVPFALSAWLTDGTDIFRAYKDWRLWGGVSVNDEMWMGRRE